MSWSKLKFEIFTAGKIIESLANETDGSNSSCNIILLVKSLLYLL